MTGWLLQVYAGLMLPLFVVGAIWTIFLYFDLPSMGGDSDFGAAVSYSLSLNWFPVIAFLALAGAYAMFLIRVTAPFFQSISGPQGATSNYGT